MALDQGWTDDSERLIRLDDATEALYQARRMAEEYEKKASFWRTSERAWAMEIASLRTGTGQVRL